MYHIKTGFRQIDQQKRRNASNLSSSRIAVASTPQPPSIPNYPMKKSNVLALDKFSIEKAALRGGERALETLYHHSTLHGKLGQIEN